MSDKCDICIAALNRLGDLNFNGHVALESYRIGDISLKEYIAVIRHYKNLRDILWRAGCLPEDWDDGKI